jgi:hypothetical protein
MAFRDILKNDISIFLNPDEHAETHTIDGVGYNIVVDNSVSTKVDSEFIGVYRGDITIYVSASDLGEIPKKNRLLTFDGIPCNVIEAKDESGLCKIILEAVES